VAFGNPKQEKWIKANRERVGVPVLIGVGGTLDLLTAGKRRAPRWVGRLGLEWVFRAVQEPVRLGRRYLNDIRVFGPQFLMSLLFWARRHRQRDRAVTITWAENAVDVQFHSTAPLSAADKGAVLAAVRQARRTAAVLRVGPCTAQQGVVLAQLGA